MEACVCVCICTYYTYIYIYIHTYAYVLAFADAFMLHLLFVCVCGQWHSCVVTCIMLMCTELLIMCQDDGQLHLLSFASHLAMPFISNLRRRRSHQIACHFLRLPRLVQLATSSHMSSNIIHYISLVVSEAQSHVLACTHSCVVLCCV